MKNQILKLKIAWDCKEILLRSMKTKEAVVISGEVRRLFANGVPQATNF